MPGPVVSRQLSSESLNALLLALGLSHSENATEQSMGIEPVVAIRRPMAKKTLHPQRPTTPFSKMDFAVVDEAQIFGREFFSDFDIFTDLEEDSEPNFETLPSRPGSSLESFEMVVPSVIPQHHVFCSTSSGTSVPNSPSLADHIDIKAAHNATIIMLRAPRDIRFADLKRRLYDKFVNQENILLSHSFSIILALPPSSSPERLNRGCRRMSLANCTEMRFIDQEVDWRRIVTTNDGSKITLRILDTPP